MMNRTLLSRRDFLHTTAAAGASLAAGPLFLDSEPALAADTPTAASDRLRFGIVGVGMEGTNLLTNAIQLPGVECVAAADLYDGRHDLAREIVGKPIKTTRRYQELLDDKEIDAIIVAVPDHWHKQVVIDAVAAGKDVYCEKPMSHSPADGLAMVAAAKKTDRIVQAGAQRVSSAIAAKAKELYDSGAIGELTLVEGSYGRNSPSGAWIYPPPPDLSPQNMDWDTWLGTTPKKAFDPILFARWRCWRDYGTGVAGDLLVHQLSGMLFVMGINEAPRRASATGGIFRWKDGRDMPDVHSTLFEYGNIPVYMRLTLTTQQAEITTFMGTKGSIEMRPLSVTYIPQDGADRAPSSYVASFPARLKGPYVKQWRKEHEPAPGQEKLPEAAVTYDGWQYDRLPPHLYRFFDAVRTRKPVVEDVVFGHHAALGCHMANQAYFRKSIVTWDEAAQEIKS